MHTQHFIFIFSFLKLHLTRPKVSSFILLSYQNSYQKNISSIPNQWEGVHDIIHSIEALIDLKFQTTNIYDRKQLFLCWDVLDQVNSKSDLSRL